LLKDKLTHDRNKDLQTFRKEISELLIDEIVTRYYFQKGRIIASFNTDIEIDSTVNLLINKDKYDSILLGKAGELNNDKVSSKGEKTLSEDIEN
jgi:carboxyl-terminal processing protease